MVVIAELLSGGADPNVRDNTGCTPFHNFIHGRHNQETKTAGVITWVDYGAKLDIQDYYASNCWNSCEDAPHTSPPEDMEKLEACHYQIVH